MSVNTASFVKMAVVALAILSSKYTLFFVVVDDVIIFVVVDDACPYNTLMSKILTSITERA